MDGVTQISSHPPSLAVRWSEHEARKPYARPFAVTFMDRDSTPMGGVAVSGSDLLYYRQFQGAVLTLAGELFLPAEVETSEEPQRLWLDLLSALLPASGDVALVPASDFDEREGRRFHFRLAGEAFPWTRFSAASLLDYQEFQAALAHQTGRLHRRRAIEELADQEVRRRAWIKEVREMLERPAEDEAMSSAWPWR